MNSDSTVRRLVVDAGICYMMVAPVEATAHIWELISGQIAAGAHLYAPTLLRYELTSTLTKTISLGGMSEARGRESLRQALALPVNLVTPDASLTRAAFDWTRRLRRAAAYDSFYLALAQTLDCELWTGDRRLANAANVAWVRLVGQANR
jgi:predicted nucleic acid-binding protein